MERGREREVGQSGNPCCGVTGVRLRERGERSLRGVLVRPAHAPPVCVCLCVYSATVVRPMEPGGDVDER